MNMERLRLLSEKLTETESILSGFFNMRDELFVVASSDNQFVKVNAKWEHAFGFSNDECCAVKYFEFIHPDDIEKTNSAHNVLASGGHISNFTNRYRCKDGSYKTVLWDATPYADGKYTYAMGRIIDG